MFEFEDVELEFTDDGLGAVADQALMRVPARETFERSWKVLLNDVRLAGLRDIAKVVIDADTVFERVNPTLVPRELHLVSAALPPDIGRNEL